MSANKNRIVVLGSGNFGTCLAQHLADKGYKISLWCRSSAAAEAINKNHKNPKYLTSVTLSHRIEATNKLDDELLQSAFAIVIATPTQALREVLGAIRPVGPTTLLVGASKGIELSSLKLPVQVVGDVLGAEAARRLTVLSGPSFAAEVVQRQPTAVCVASSDEGCAQRAQELFHAAHFRVYTSDDPQGVEVAGALKNVIAIASGACEGIGYQMNSRAALITRGLAEITRVGVALGANPLTFKGLSGVGDLFLTCTSEKSRNYSVGFRLGRGEALEAALGEVGSVAEGVATAKAAFELARKLKVSTPIIDEVYRVIYERKPITQAVTDLITRDAKPELDLPEHASLDPRP